MSTITPMRLDFATLDQPLEPVVLPRGPNGAPGRTFAAQEFTLGMQKLAVRVDEGDEDAARELLRRCLPGVTDDEIDALTPREAVLIIAFCGRRLAEVVSALKNVEGAEAAPTTSPSAPTTNTSTPSPVSPAPPAKTGGRSPRNRSTASSTASIG